MSTSIADIEARLKKHSTHQYLLHLATSLKESGGAVYEASGASPLDLADVLAYAQHIAGKEFTVQTQVTSSPAAYKVNLVFAPVQVTEEDSYGKTVGTFLDKGLDKVLSWLDAKRLEQKEEQLEYQKFQQERFRAWKWSELKPDLTEAALAEQIYTDFGDATDWKLSKTKKMPTWAELGETEEGKGVQAQWLVTAAATLKRLFPETEEDLEDEPSIVVTP